MLRIQDHQTKRFFEIPKGASIDFELYNPAFNYSIQRTSFSFPLNLDASDQAVNNRAIWEFANRPDVVSTNKKKSTPITIFIGMTPIFEGVMYLIKSTQTSFRVNIELDGGEFVELLGDQKITDLNLDDDLPNPYDYVTLNTMGVSIPRHNDYVAFPMVYNPTFSSINTTPHMNDFDAGLVDYRYNLAANIFDRRNYRVCPMFKLEHIMWLLAQWVGYNVGIINEDLSIFNDFELNKGLVIYNRTDAYNFYEAPFPGTTLNRIYYKDHLPENLKARTLFSEVAKLFNLSYRFDLSKKSVTTISNNSLLDKNTLGTMDWSKKAIYIDRDTNKNTARTFAYNSEFQDGEEEFFQPYTAGTGTAQEVTLGVGSLPYDPTTLTTQDTLGKTGNRRINNFERKSSLLPRLLMYRYNGLVNIRPTATAAPTTGYNYSLEWGGANGLYNQFHKPWTELVNSVDPVTYQVPFNKRDFLTFDIQKQPLTKYGRHIIKSMKLKLTNTPNPLFTPATVEMLEVPL